MNSSDILMNARCRLIAKEPFYGHMAMKINWIKSDMHWKQESQRTMGVRVVDGGEIQCLNLLHNNVQLKSYMV